MIEAFERTTAEVLCLEELKAMLESGRRLKVKFGADVTAPFLHLGHAVNLWMLREMQDRGHLVQFLIGDFTTRIGDPTGRDAARAERSPEDIERDAKEFIRQVGKILITDDPERFQVLRNSAWWDGKPLSEFLRLLGSVSAQKLLSRDMFKARMEEGRDIRAHELVYPVLQGWDSVEMESDLTIVGSDQLFNESMARVFQERAGQRPQVVITTKITPGLDGVRKQSKSLNNFIALDDNPREVFGKAMSLPDSLVLEWLEVYTTVPLERIRAMQAALDDGSLHPRDAKLELAQELTARLHGAERGLAEREWFMSTFSARAFPVDAPVLEADDGLPLLELCSLALPGASRSELRRLIEAGAVELDGSRAVEPFAPVALGSSRRLRAGRRAFFRISPRAGQWSSVGPCGWGC